MGVSPTPRRRHGSVPVEGASPRAPHDTSAFTLGRISFEKSMKPLRGFFDLGLESFLALAAGLAMVKICGRRGGPRGSRDEGRAARGVEGTLGGGGLRCEARGDGA